MFSFISEAASRARKATGMRKKPPPKKKTKGEEEEEEEEEGELTHGIIKPSEMKRLRELYDVYDDDNSGTIDSEEFKSMVIAVRLPTLTLSHAK